MVVVSGLLLSVGVVGVMVVALIDYDYEVGEDGVVDMEHYYRMKLVLDRLGKEAEYLVVEGEGHGFRYLSTETDFYRRLDAFFRRTMDLPTVSLEQVLKNDATWPELAGEHSF